MAQHPRRQHSSFTFLFYEFKNEIIQGYNFAGGSVWVYNLVSDIKGGTMT
jgi:hypothetical protein